MKRLESVQDYQQLKGVVEKRRDPSALSVTVCCGTGCVASGAREVYAKFQEEIKANMNKGKRDFAAVSVSGKLTTMWGDVKNLKL